MVIIPNILRSSSSRTGIWPNGCKKLKFYYSMKNSQEWYFCKCIATSI